jgi:hypothetical protein
MKLQEIKTTGTVLEDGQVECTRCKNVAKNERGHNLHWTLVHGKGRGGKYKTGKKKNQNRPIKDVQVKQDGSATLTIDTPGEIGGNKFMLTVELSIATTGIRPLGGGAGGAGK